MQHWYNGRQIGMLYNDTRSYIVIVPHNGIVLRRICLEAEGPSININVHRNPSNARKGEGSKCLVRILLLTKTLKMSAIQPCQQKLLSSVKSKCVK